MFAERCRCARCSLLLSAVFMALCRVDSGPGKEDRSAMVWQKERRSALSSGVRRMSIIMRRSRWKVARSAAK